MINNSDFSYIYFVTFFPWKITHNLHASRSFRRLSKAEKEEVHFRLVELRHSVRSCFPGKASVHFLSEMRLGFPSPQIPALQDAQSEHGRETIWIIHESHWRKKAKINFYEKGKSPDSTQILHNTSHCLKRVNFTGFLGNWSETFNATHIQVSGHGLGRMNNQLLSLLGDNYEMRTINKLVYELVDGCITFVIVKT